MRLLPVLLVFDPAVISPNHRDVAVLVFVQSWNDYLLPLVILNRDTLYPWPLGIIVYQGDYSTDRNLILAFITLTILPAIIMFFAVQKRIVAGLMAGSVKG